MSDLWSEGRAKILESARFQVGFQILKIFIFPKVRTSEIVTKCYQGLGIRVSDPVQIPWSLDLGLHPWSWSLLFGLWPLDQDPWSLDLKLILLDS